MVPRDFGAYQAAGNTASCTAQGFLESYLYGLSVLMNAILAITYCVIVRRGKKDEAKSKRSRWIVSALDLCGSLHSWHKMCSSYLSSQLLGLPPIFCFLLASKPLFDQAYNYTAFIFCDIAEYPLGCLSDNSDDECTRGSKARELKMARFACICLANVTIVVAVCVLVKHVMHVERRMALSNPLDVDNSNELTAKVTWQGIWYVAAFFFSWGPW